MLEVLFEDAEIIVVVKPVGLESQSSHSFEPDMVSEIKKHIHNLSPEEGEPYVGVIHRLDKPVGGVMVYAKTPKAAATLSKAVQEGMLKKTYRAIVCGKPVDNVGNFVDYLLKNPQENTSQIVDKGITGAKRAELEYRVLSTIKTNTLFAMPSSEPEQSDKMDLTLVEISLKTGRHHQIRVQFSGHGLPLCGDSRYNPAFAEQKNIRRRENISLFASSLTFPHPNTGEFMTFSKEPAGRMWAKFE